MIPRAVVDMLAPRLPLPGFVEDDHDDTRNCRCPAMKLGSLPGGGDGHLVVVSRDLTVCSDARHIAPSLAAALADWDAVAPELDLIARGVEALGQPLERFHERAAAAPLPRGGGAQFDDPRAPIRPAGSGDAAITAEVGLATVGGAGARPGSSPSSSTSARAAPPSRRRR